LSRNDSSLDLAVGSFSKWEFLSQQLQSLDSHSSEETLAPPCTSFKRYPSCDADSQLL